MTNFEEDMLNRCISSIEEAKENRYAYKETDGDTSYDEEIAWLRNHCFYKPTDEQMEALAMAVTFFNEKKYKEALERARALRNEAIEKEYVDDYIKDYETIFPELRESESEDERIRKHLIKHFSNKSKEEWNGMPIKDILAWLEKQKEQKPVEWKPTEEQMHTLEEIINNVKQGIRPYSSEIYHLEELLEQLRKL